MQIALGQAQQATSLALGIELNAANIAHVPDWLRTAEGKKFVQQATAGIKKFMGEKAGGAGTDTPPKPGQPPDVCDERESMTRKAKTR